MNYTIHNADCLKQLKKLQDNSIDSIVTDPPYGLEFMGKDWDAPWKASEVVEVTDESTNGIFATKGFSHGVRFSRGQKEMFAFQKWTQEWATECLRVLKPGGHLLAFGGTRTYHRLAVAIEDAGFEIRDSIHWTYGSGFPKSLDVSKAIDKAAGAEREVLQHRTMTQGGGTALQMRMGDKREVQANITAPATPAAKQWEGWGTALKPSHEPIVVARKPLVGTVAETVLEYGTGGLNIDGCRVGAGDGSVKTVNYPDMRGNNYNNAKGTVEYTVKSQGRFPANTVLTHSAGCQQTGETMKEEAGKPTLKPRANSGATNYAMKSGTTPAQSTPLYQCVQGCPIAELDKQSGTSKSTQRTGKRTGKKAQTYGAFTGQEQVKMGHNDTGGASRFFTQTHWTQWDDITPFIYISKASKKERNKGLEEVEAKRHADRVKTDGKGGDNPRNRTNTPKQNFHPTVKPVELMRHLCRLVTPPNGTVLDPFTGSGSTGVAAILEGFQFIGIELTEEYIPIIKARLKQAEKEYKNTQPTLPLEETQ